MILSQIKHASTFCFILGLRQNELLSLTPEDICEDGTSVLIKCGNGTRKIPVPTDYVKEIRGVRYIAIQKKQSKLF